MSVAMIGVSTARAIAMTAMIAPAPVAIASTAPEHPAPHPIREKRNRADENGHEDHHANIAIADVRQLVRDHPLELGAVQLVEKAARHRDRCVLRIASGG